MRKKPIYCLSSVIIKGMNLPENCHTCEFAYSTLGSIIHCKFHIYPVEKFSKSRHFKCPFSAEVPTPHGDLIDKDLLLKEYEPDPEDDQKMKEESLNNYVLMTKIVDLVKESINKMPIVIKAEE